MTHKSHYVTEKNGRTIPQLILPIPLTVITQNPNVIIQNSGY
jgi:hypothetical protein